MKIIKARRQAAARRTKQAKDSGADDVNEDIFAEMNIGTLIPLLLLPCPKPITSYPMSTILTSCTMPHLYFRQSISKSGKAPKLYPLRHSRKESTDQSTSPSEDAGFLLDGHRSCLPKHGLRRRGTPQPARVAVFLPR